jgi:hypothetical protein
VVGSLITWLGSAEVVPLVTVIHAERAHVGEAGASPGATIYEGDHLSTEVGGVLRVAGVGLSLQLASQSHAVLRVRPAEPGKLGGKMEAELVAGTLIFSTTSAGDIAVNANGASVHSARCSPAVGQIAIVNRKELHVYAQHGVLQFSYKGETTTISEGRNYRVLLDPGDNEIGGIPETDPSNKPPGQQHHTFLLVAIAVGLAAIAIPVLIHLSESPHRP